MSLSGAISRVGLSVTNSGWRRIELLQLVHPVGDAERPLAVVAAVADIVPARPDALALRHQARVGMQHRLVVGVGEGAEQRALLLVRIGEQLQRLVGMRRDRRRR